MTRLNDQLAQTGYSAEELYCHKADQERIEKLRKRQHLKLVHSVHETEKEIQERQASMKLTEDSGGGHYKKVA